MKSRLVRLGVLIASVMGLLVTSTPAEATYFKNVTLNGVDTLFNCNSTGFGYPGTPLGTTTIPDTFTTTKAGPKGEPEVNTTVRNGNTCDFGFTAQCLKLSVGKKVGFDTCIIVAIGTVTGFCGASSGTGTAVLINTSNTIQPKLDVVTDFKFSSTGTTMRVSGGDDTLNIHGQMTVQPNLAAAGSCTNKTATSFIVTGDVVVKKCTPSFPC